MILISEIVEVVTCLHREGENEKGKYAFDSLYYNLENGIQESIVIPKELVEKVKKGDKIKLKCEIGYRGKINVKEIIKNETK